MKRFTRTAVGIALGFGVVFSTGLMNTPVSAVEAENCKTVTQNMVRPDSGVAGYWATDTFVRNVKVCVETPPVLAEKAVAITSAKFKIVGEDNGTFMTQGVKSPMGNPMLPGLKGTFTGKFAGIFIAPFDAANPTNWPGWSPTGSNDDKTLAWVYKLWTNDVEHKGELTSWVWDYATCNETHRQSHSTGNTGDITGKSLKSIEKCLVVTHTVLCDGKVDVKIENKLVAGIKVTINGLEKQLAYGANTFTGVTTTEGWLRIKFLGQQIYGVKCFKPTTCPTPTPTATTTTPPAPTTNPPTLPPLTPAAGTGNLAVTPGTSSNTVQMIAGIGLSAIAVGGLLFLFLIVTNRRKKFIAE